MSNSNFHGEDGEEMERERSLCGLLSHGDDETVTSYLRGYP
jgi:hypothetical protein